MLVRSPLLEARGVVHGFSTREGGVSEGRYASLNVGAKWGDDPARVAENRRRLADAGGFALERLYTARQVHGAEVVRVEGALTPDEVQPREADALATATTGATVGVYTADCVPLLLADDAGRVAAVHAGWRGTVADIAARAVEALEALGARRDRLVAALGPHICPDCFEVGDEVAAHFEPLGSVVRKPAWPKPHVDLYAANRRLLARAGVETVDERPPCTMHEPARFFSFRRDGGQGTIGQMLSFVSAARATR